MTNFISMKNTYTTNPTKKENKTRTNLNEFNEYCKKINQIKNLDIKEEKRLAQEAKNGNLIAKNILIESNLKLVITIARKAIHVSKLPLTDLIQEGNIGLMVAIDKFNPNLGYRFSTYATWWIKQAMFKAISEQSHCMKIPVYVQETLSKFSKIKSEMELKTNSHVNNKEVAEKMDIEPEKIDNYLAAYTTPISIEGSFDINNGNELPIAEIIADKNSNVEASIEYEELKKEITNIVAKLKEREQTVIKMRFGLENFTKTTLEEIGKNFGVTKECIRQTELRALNKLKNCLAY